MLTVARFFLAILLAAIGLVSLMAAVQSGARSPLIVALVFAAGAWALWPKRKPALDEREEAEAVEEDKAERVVPLEERLEEIEGVALRASLDHLEAMVLAEMEAAGLAQGEAARTALRRLGGHPEGDAQREAEYRRVLRRTVLALALNRIRADLTSANPWPVPLGEIPDAPVDAEPATA